MVGDSYMIPKMNMLPTPSFFFEDILRPQMILCGSNKITRSSMKLRVAEAISIDLLSIHLPGIVLFHIFSWGMHVRLNAINPAV